MTDIPNRQPLTGLRVVDMTSLAMGPLATQVLGDYGADVIKIEPPAGDPFRATLPMRSAGMGHAYLQLNRNKRSLAMDLKAAGTQSAFRELVRRADVFVSNVRPSGMRGLGLDYGAIKSINPAIIYCAAYGFSEEGPYAGRPAADDTIQAMSGIANLQGRAAGGAPSLVASVVADKACGLTLVNAVLAALIHRMRTGEGQCIEVSMFETMVAFVMPEHMAGLSFEPPLGPAGYNRIINPARRPYATKDGHLSVLPYTTPQWQRFFRLIGRDDLATDPDLAVAAKRNARLPELYALIADALPSRTTADWIAALLAADILFGEAKAPEDLLTDPHLEAVGLFASVDHPTEGRVRLINPPVRSSAAPTRIGLLPPVLGQHTRDILAELGLPQDEIAGLIAQGSVLAAESDDGRRPEDP